MNLTKPESIPLSPEDFVLPSRYPEFATEDRELIARFLLEASEYCPELVWGKGDLRTRAIALYVAHKLSARLYQMGAIASLSVAASRGDIVQLPVSPEKSLNFTVYGQEFQELYDRLPKSGFVC